jgi:tRNA G46 methylase TrmB
LLRKGVIEDLARLLRPGGCLYLATDFFDYYLQAVVLLLLHPELEVDRDPARVPAYADAELSRYGPRLAALGKSIHYATARRRR